MNFLRTFWPYPFQVKKGDVASLIVKLVIFVVVCTVVGWIVSLLSHIWIIGVIFTLIGSLLELYGVVGIVLCLLCFFGIL